MNEILEMYLNLDMKNEQEKEELLRRIDTLTNACSMDEIRTDRMSDPSPEKIWYYEQYYQKTKKLPHGIVVDENRQLRDGYISYLLAKKYNIRADICEMVSGQPLRKIVGGMHVKFSDVKWRKTGRKRYIWIYTLKSPVVPGDILMVNTKKGKAFICVDKIDYAAGKFCSKYKKVRKHLNTHLEKEGTSYEK